MPERIGRRIALLREAAGMSQTGLAEACKVTEGAIRQIEDGTTKNPSFQTGVLIAQALGLTPYELAFDRKPPAAAEATLPSAAGVEQRLVDLEEQVAGVRLSVARIAQSRAAYLAEMSGQGASQPKPPSQRLRKRRRKKAG